MKITTIVDTASTIIMGVALIAADAPWWLFVTALAFGAAQKWHGGQMLAAYLSIN